MMKKVISRILVFALVLSFVSFTPLNSSSPQTVSSAKSYADGGCVSWAKDRARALLGITLRGTGNWPSGVYGASNWWYVLNYPKDQSASANSLAIWSGGTGKYAGYGHVAYVENVSGGRIELSEGGVSSASNGVRRAWFSSMNRSGYSFLGYVHLTSTSSSLPNFSRFLLQTGTCLGETGNDFSFCTGDYNQDGSMDLFAIKRYNTGTKSTEVHILDGASGYKRFLLQTGIPIEENTDTFEYCIGDYNSDGKPDLYAIKKYNTGAHALEVHILNGASSYQSFLLQTGTKIEECRDQFKFGLGDYNRDGRIDLYAIKTKGTGTGNTEIHILNGASNYTGFLMQTGTALGTVGSNFEFGIGDCNKDGKPDIYAIKKSSTGTKTTEIHILNGANSYSSFLFQTGTCLGITGNNFIFSTYDYNKDGSSDIVAIKKNDTGSKSTELHIF